MEEYFNLFIILPDKNKQKTIADEISKRRKQALDIEKQAEEIVKKAKLQIEKILLGDTL